MSNVDPSTKESLDNILHEYAMHVLKMSQVPIEKNPNSFLEDVRERKRKILLKKKEVISNISRIFKQ
jgi:hypothetical protein